MVSEQEEFFENRIGAYVVSVWVQDFLHEGEMVEWTKYLEVLSVLRIFSSVGFGPTTLVCKHASTSVAYSHCWPCSKHVVECHVCSWAKNVSQKNKSTVKKGNNRFSGVLHFTLQLESNLFYWVFNKSDFFKPAAWTFSNVSHISLWC